MKNILITAFIAAIVSGAVIHFLSTKEHMAPAEAEPAYARVINTGKLRCGYATWPPYMMKNPNTGQLEGINYDTMEAIARELKLDIEWGEEVPWGQVATALNTGRIDAMCATIWEDADRIKTLTLTAPHFYSAVRAYVRADDARFDGNISHVNQADIKIATIDGDVTDVTARLDFPKAQIMALPQMASGAELLLSVATKKADITFVDNGLFKNYAANNAGVLKTVEGVEPVRIFSEVISVAQGEYGLRDMLDDGAQVLINNGEMARTIRKYEADYLVPKKPF